MYIVNPVETKPNAQFNLDIGARTRISQLSTFSGISFKEY